MKHSNLIRKVGVENVQFYEEKYDKEVRTSARGIRFDDNKAYFG